MVRGGGRDEDATVVRRACKSGLRMCECACYEGCTSAGIEGGEAHRVRVFPLQRVPKRQKERRQQLLQNLLVRQVLLMIMKLMSHLLTYFIGIQTYDFSQVMDQKL